MVYDAYTQPASAVLDALDSSRDGIAPSAAQERLEAYGRNELTRKKAVSVWVVFLRQFASPLILVLIGATAISMLLAEWLDAAVIAAAVIINTLIGFGQEYKASRALDELQKFIRPKARVRRGGKELEVDAADIVPGDILLFASGDRVAADARLVRVVDLEMDEAALTGESEPVEKHTRKLSEGRSIGDRTNTVYAGTSAVSGRGEAVVVATGAKTEIGRIARMVEETENVATPLQRELKELAAWISALVVVLVIILFALGLWLGHDLLEMFELSVALAVAAVPEGLAVGVTVVLAIGMQRILKRRSLVRRLVAAETLGSVTVICTDKTGTITEGKMRLTELWAGGETTPMRPDAQLSEDILRVLRISMLCNDAAFLQGEAAKGTPTQRAFIEAGAQVGLDAQDLRKEHARIDEIPFTSARKYMATLNSWEDGRRILIMGAPEIILEMCGDAADAEAVTREADAMAERGLRVLATAYKSVPEGKKSVETDDLAEMSFAGLAGLRDPLRAGVREQIDAARTAGIRTVIVTGDHPRTALAIAREAGIDSSEDAVVSGTELDAMEDAVLEKRAGDITIYARVEPRQKIRIVRALQGNREVVAMVGDGVNDAPALKSADIGVAVGSGTEVAKQASDMVILDNNIRTITAAVEEGRVIFDNIRKSAVYLLADNFTEIVLIAGALIMRLPLPLLPVQILWVNLVADSLPNVGLMLEPGEKDIMRLPPRGRGENVLNREMLTLIGIIGVVVNIVLLLLFIWYLDRTGDPQLARTVMFAAVGIDSLLYVFAIKSFRRTIFRINPFSNLWLVGGVAIGFALMGVALIHPFFREAFEIAPLSLFDWTILFILGIMKLVAIELIKEAFIFLRKRGYSV